MRWVLGIAGLFLADVMFMLLWFGGTSLDDDCDHVRRTPEPTAEDWACTGFVQTVGPYSLVPLVAALGLTVYAVVHEARRARHPA